MNPKRSPTASRRRFLASVAGAGALGLAGCTGGDGGGTVDLETTSAAGQTTTADLPSTADLDALPPLEGELTVYLGRGEGGLYGDLVSHFENERYPEFTLNLKRGPSSGLANTIVSEAEHGSPRADVFWSIDVASLGRVARAGLAAPLPRSLAGLVPDQFRDDQRRWVGISGRARSIPYNTEAVDASAVPDSIFEVPGVGAFQDALGWAPSYGSFQAFVTAMRLLEGEERTREWLEGMQDAGAQSYAGEFSVTKSIAEGTLTAGVANHYYALRYLEARPDAPLDLAFTSGGPGALINASGALVLAASDRQETAANFVHHFLTRQVQSFLVERAYEYPFVPGVDPPTGSGVDLPTLAALDPPPVDLTELSDLQPTLDLLRETGVL